jgi:hypothetical protein
VAVLPANGALQTFDGENWAELSRGVRALASLAAGSIEFTLTDGTQGSYDGNTYTPLTSSTKAIVPLADDEFAVLHSDGTLTTFDGSNWVTLSGGITTIARLNGGKVAVLPANGAFQTFDGQHWAMLSGGITTIAPLNGGKVAVLPANGVLQTFDGQNWATLSGGITAIAPLPGGTIAVLPANGVLQSYDGQHWSNVTTGVRSISPLGNGTVAVIHSNGQVQTFNGQTLTALQTPTLSLDPANDSGLRNGDNSGADLTTGTTVYLTGTATPGEQVLIGYGGPFGTATQPVVAGPNGTFSVTLAKLPVIGYGQHYWAHAIGYLGTLPLNANSITSSWSPNVYFSVAPPPTPTLMLTTADRTGMNNKEFLPITGQTVTLTGTAEPNELVNVAINGPNSYSFQQQVKAGSSGSFALSVTPPLLTDFQHYSATAQGVSPGGSLQSGTSGAVEFCVKTYIPDWTAVAYTNGQPGILMIQGGERRLISAADWQSIGGSASYKIQYLSPAQMNAIPQGPNFIPEGTAVVCSDGRPGILMIQGGMGHLISAANWAAIGGASLDPVRSVPPSQFTAIPMGSTFTPEFSALPQIYAKWRHLGGDNSTLGSFVSQQPSSDKRGTVAYFQHGVIYWSSTTGALAVDTSQFPGKVVDFALTPPKAGAAASNSTPTMNLAGSSSAPSSQTTCQATVKMQPTSGSQLCAFATVYGLTLQYCETADGVKSGSVGIGSFGSLSVGSDGDISLGFSITALMPTGGWSVGANVSVTKPEVTIQAGTGDGGSIPGAPFGLGVVEYQTKTYQLPDMSDILGQGDGGSGGDGGSDGSDDSSDSDKGDLNLTGHH